nr:type II toxin-antitoxin system HigB family toxin [Escherichia coli]
MGSCAAPSAKGDDKFITTDYLQQCRKIFIKHITTHAEYDKLTDFYRRTKE